MSALSDLQAQLAAAVARLNTATASPAARGDGLVAPLNAPPAGYGGAGGVTGIGVQPGTTSGVIAAQYVIVSGGTASGVFVYSGVPGPGNGPDAWMTSGDTDPYGNPVTPYLGAKAGLVQGSVIAPATITAQQIADATITAGQIAAATITGANIAGTTITAANILDATITAAQIATGGIQPSNIASLTASLIGNLGVLNPNPYFTGGDDTGWSATNGTITVTSSPPSGAVYKYALEYVNNGSANGYAEEVNGKFPVTPGQQYMATAWLYNTGTGATGAIRLSIDWYDGSTYVSTSTGNVTVTTGTWTQATEVFTAPSSGVNAGVVKFGTQTGDGSTVYGQAVLVMPQVPGALIEAGTVEAAQIAAGTITGALIAANTITGSNIAAGTITATNIEAGTITAGLLAAGIVVAGIVDGTLIEGAEFVVDETGSGTGMFVYDSSPGEGTPPVIAVTASDTDPFGNSTTPGDATTGKPQVIVTGAAPSGGTATFIQMTPGSTSTSPAALQIGTGYPSEITPGQVVSGITGSDPAALITTVIAPEAGSSGTSTSGQSYLELFTSTNGAPGFGLSGASEYGSYELAMQTASGTSGTYSQFSVSTDAGDVMILLPDLVLMTCQLVAQEPGSPGTSESWHEATLASGWENNGGAYAPMRYRLLPDGNLQIDGLVKSTSASATTIFTLPTGYIPTYDAEFPVTSGTDSRYGFLIANTGVVEGLSISASGQLVEIHVIIPLD